jgi:pre-60S factor REI1
MTLPKQNQESASKNNVSPRVTQHDAGPPKKGGSRNQPVVLHHHHNHNCLTTTLFLRPHHCDPFGGDVIMSTSGLTSTTAPGKVFTSRSELAEHYKSDWHKYNLKRREAGLPLLRETDFQARLEAALALRKEREGKEERSGTDHLKKGKDNKKKQVTTKKQAAAYDRINHEGTPDDDDGDGDGEVSSTENSGDEEMGESNVDDSTLKQMEDTIIEPRQCLFDKHISGSVEANLERMQRKYGFFLPDQEYLVDAEGLVGYCQEKIKLGHYCLYCQRMFSSWQACQKHMIATRHTKLRYERGVDLEEFDPFYDFTEADEAFLGSKQRGMEEMNEEVMEGDSHDNDDDDDDEWEDVTDDEEEDMEGVENANDVQEEDGNDGLYAAYKDEIANFGFGVTSLGELILPDGRIIGHRGLLRYYKQRVGHNHNQERAAVAAARRAAGERVFNGRVYNVGRQQDRHKGGGETSALALARNGRGFVNPGKAGHGILVSNGGGGFTAVSLYRYQAVVKKARRDDARGQRLENRTKQNMNRMDKKANRLMNGVSVAHAAR